jgi:hypothetical protein
MRSNRLKSSSKIPGLVELVIVSPLKRTLDTATITFDGLTTTVPWVALECIRETTGLCFLVLLRLSAKLSGAWLFGLYVTGPDPCNKRSAISSIRSRWAHVDMSHIESDEVRDDLFRRRGRT